MTRKNILASLGLAALMALPSIGCMVHGSGHAHVGVPVAVVEVESEPPPPRRVTVVHRPGFIWIEGRWDWRGGNWVWVDGHYERERVGYIYAPGRWERRGRRHVWVEGRWNAGARANDRYDSRTDTRVRDHRDHRDDDDDDDRGRGGGPIIRDHRR